MDIADKYSEQVRESREIVFEGLRFFPLRVSQYALYRAGQDAFEIMQSSLSPELARMGWFNCLDALDREIELKTGRPGDYLARAVLVIKAALKMDELSKLMVKRNEKGNIAVILIQTEPVSNPVLLKPAQMAEIRKIIAAQNRYTIPDEAWNLDLYRAQKTLEEKSGDSGLRGGLDDLVCSVAVNSGTKPEEIWSWTIKTFLDMQEAIDRKLGFMLCYMAERVGQIKYTRGNPYPSWRLSRDASEPAGFKTLGEIEGKAAEILHAPEMT